MPNHIHPRLHRRIIDTLAARFSPEGQYGLHLTAGVAMLLLATALFVHMAGAVVAGAPITQLDVEVANWLHLHARANEGLRQVLLAITHVHSTPGILIMALVAALLVWGLGSALSTVVLFALGPIAAGNVSAALVELIQEGLAAIVSVLFVVVVCRLYVQATGGGSVASVPHAGGD